MKKKICIVILIICLLAIILFGMYLIDRNRMRNNKPVIFSNWGYQYVPPIDLPEKEIKAAIMNYVIEKAEAIKISDVTTSLYSPQETNTTIKITTLTLKVTILNLCSEMKTMPTLLNLILKLTLNL